MGVPGRRAHGAAVQVTFRRPKQSWRPTARTSGAASAGAPCAAFLREVASITTRTFSMTSGFVMNATVAEDWASMTFDNSATWERGRRGRASVTLTGPADVWFVGTGSSSMAQGTYAIVVGGDAGDVTERPSGPRRAPPSPVSLRPHSERTSAGTRTVVLSARLSAGHVAGAYFDFDEHAASVPLIVAVGAGPKPTTALGQAQRPCSSRRAGHLVCAGGESGHRGHPVQQPLPGAEQQLWAQRNDVATRTYGGPCCSHGTHLLIAQAAYGATQVDTTG